MSGRGGQGEADVPFIPPPVGLVPVLGKGNAVAGYCAVAGTARE